MVCETFVHHRSIMHRLDPRSRVLAGAAISVGVAVSGRGAVALGGLVLGLAGVLLARLAGPALLKRLATLNLFMLLVVGLLPFSVPGAPLFQVGPFNFSRVGALAALLIAVKGNAIVLVLTACLSTIELTRLGQALRRLLVPAKLTHLFLFTVRYLDALHHEYHRLHTAMRVRCFHLRPSLYALRMLGYSVGMLLIRTLDRSERIWAAMRCRGFRGEFHALDRLSYSRLDVWFGAGCAVAVVGLLLLEWL